MTAKSIKLFPKNSQDSVVEKLDIKKPSANEEKVTRQMRTSMTSQNSTFYTSANLSSVKANRLNSRRDALYIDFNSEKKEEKVRIKKGKATVDPRVVAQNSIKSLGAKKEIDNAQKGRFKGKRFKHPIEDKDQTVTLENGKPVNLAKRKNSIRSILNSFRSDKREVFFTKIKSLQNATENDIHADIEDSAKNKVAMDGILEEVKKGEEINSNFLFDLLKNINIVLDGDQEVITNIIRGQLGDILSSMDALTILVDGTYVLTKGIEIVNNLRYLANNRNLKKKIREEIVTLNQQIKKNKIKINECQDSTGKNKLLEEIDRIEAQKESLIELKERLKSLTKSTTLKTLSATFGFLYSGSNAVKNSLQIAMEASGKALEGAAQSAARAATLSQAASGMGTALSAVSQVLPILSMIQTGYEVMAASRIAQQKQKEIRKWEGYEEKLEVRMHAFYIDQIFKDILAPFPEGEVSKEKFLLQLKKHMKEKKIPDDIQKNILKLCKEEAKFFDKEDFLNRFESQYLPDNPKPQEKEKLWSFYSTLCEKSQKGELSKMKLLEEINKGDITPRMKADLTYLVHSLGVENDSISLNDLEKIKFNYLEVINPKKAHPNRTLDEINEFKRTCALDEVSLLVSLSKTQLEKTEIQKAIKKVRSSFKGKIYATNKSVLLGLIKKELNNELLIEKVQTQLVATLERVPKKIFSQLMKGETGGIDLATALSSSATVILNKHGIKDMTLAKASSEWENKEKYSDEKKQEVAAYRVTKNLIASNIKEAKRERNIQMGIAALNAVGLAGYILTTLTAFGVMVSTPAGAIIAGVATGSLGAYRIGVLFHDRWKRKHPDIRSDQMRRQEEFNNFILRSDKEKSPTTSGVEAHYLKLLGPQYAFECIKDQVVAQQEGQFLHYLGGLKKEVDQLIKEGLKSRKNQAKEAATIHKGKNKRG